MELRLPTPEQFEKRFADRVVMAKVGARALVIIKQRTERGEFLPGSSPDSKNYSTKPLAVPSGFFNQGRLRRVWSMIQRGEVEGGVHTSSRTGNIWMTITGGYKKIRELSGRDASKVSLNWSGQMMRSLQVAEVSQNSATIRFVDSESAQKATWHAMGAGRSKVKRLFVGLTEDEWRGIVEMYGQEMRSKLDIGF